MELEQEVRGLQARVDRLSARLDLVMGLLAGSVGDVVGGGSLLGGSSADDDVIDPAELI